MRKSSRGTQVLALLLVAASFEVLAGKSGVYLFPYPMNRLGWADGSGKLSVWVNGDWKVDLGDGESLPLRFHFSSMQDRISEGLLGAGWWVPLLESTIVQRSETIVRLTALGGQTVYLYAKPGEEGLFQSKDGRWSGNLETGDTFKIEGVGGWYYRYKAGRIADATSPSGKQLRWNYLKSGLPSEILVLNKTGSISTNPSQRNLLKVDWGDNQKVEAISFGSLRITFEHDRFPKLSTSSEGYAVAGFLPYVRAINVEPISSQSVQAQRVADLEIAFDPEGMFTANFIVGPSHSVIEKFSWTPETGILKADSASNYEMKKAGSVTEIVRDFRDGHFDSYKFDAKSFIETFNEGSKKIVTQFLATPGSNFMRVSEKVITANNDDQKRYRAFFDSEGNTLREISETAGGRIEIRKKGGVVEIEESGNQTRKIISSNKMEPKIEYLNSDGSRDIISIGESGFPEIENVR